MGFLVPPQYYQYQTPPFHTCYRVPLLTTLGTEVIKPPAATLASPPQPPTSPEAVQTNTNVEVEEGSKVVYPYDPTRP